MLFSWTRRSLLTAIGASALALALDAEGRAAEAPIKPKGAVVLTIAGDIVHTNRGASSPKLDGFMNHHEIEFKNAFTFDIAMLEDYPMSEIKCQPPQYSSPVTFQGPLLRDVLKSLGAEGASIQTRALDGYAVDLTPEQIAAKDWILATRADGKPFGIGDKGPVWMIHTPSATRVPEEEEKNWPWALFYIQVKK
jgi:hypothetical protein